MLAFLSLRRQPSVSRLRESQRLAVFQAIDLYVDQEDCRWLHALVFCKMYFGRRSGVINIKLTRLDVCTQ